jgi:hypothetical protein
MSGVIEAVGDAISDVVDFAGDVVNTVVDFVGDAFKSIEKTVKAIAKDPLPTLLMIGGQMVGIPPYVTSAVITAARGGDLQDIAVSAAVSWASSELMTTTELGKSIGSMTSSVGGDVTQSMIQNFGLSEATAAAIGRAATSSLNSAIVGGVRAGLTGQDVSDGITSGLAQGAVYSGTDSFFNEVNKNPNWGLSDNAIKFVKGSTSSALNAIISGRDPAAAVGNYVAYATLKAGTSEVKKQAQKYYDEFKTATNNAEKSQTNYEQLKETYDNRVKEYENFRTDAEVKTNEYNDILKGQYRYVRSVYDQQTQAMQTKIDEYDQYVADYERYKNANDATNANAAAEKANAIAPEIDKMSSELQKFIDSNKPMFDELNRLSSEINQNSETMKLILKDIQEPSGDNLASRLKQSADQYQKDFDIYTTAEQKAEQAAKNYNQAVAELATRDAMIDALNTGALYPVSIDQNGGYVLNNGLTLATNGRFYEGDEQLFRNASGIDQKEIKFTDYNGNMVAFGEDSGRNLSQTDVQQIFERDFGYTPDQATLNQFIGRDYDLNKNEFKSVVEKQINDQYKDILGRDATAEEIGRSITPSGNSVIAAQDLAVFTAGIPKSMQFGSQDEKIGFAKTFLANQQQAEIVSQSNRQVFLERSVDEVLNALQAEGYTPDDIDQMQKSGQLSRYVDNYIKAADDQIENLKEASRNAYSNYGPGSQEYLNARRAVLDKMDEYGGYGISKQEDGSYLSKNFGQIDNTNLQPNFIPNTAYVSPPSDTGGSRSFYDPVTGILNIEMWLRSQDQTPYSGLFAIGESAKPPTEGGRTLFGGGSGTAGGPNPLKDYFSGLNLVAVDDKTGGALYQTGDGKALLLYSDGKGITVDPQTQEPIWLTPMQIDQIKDDLKANNQAPGDAIAITKAETQKAIDAGYITADEASKILADKGFLKVEEADIAKLTGVVGDTQTPEEKIGSLVTGYYDPRYTTVAEVVQEYRRQGLGDPTQEDVNRFVGRATPEDTAAAVKQNLPLAQGRMIQAQLGEMQRQQSIKDAQKAFMEAPVVAAATEEATKAKKPFVTSMTKQEEFKSPLEEFMQEVKTSDYTAEPFMVTQSPTTPQVQENMQQGESMPNYFTYGQPADLDQLFSPFGTAGTSFFGMEPMIAKRGGLATPLMAGGGSTRYGRYAGGGLPLVAHSGKHRFDFREGAAVTGEGDGQSDDIPAMLADGEFVIPADVVAALGNGSTKAGSDKLYDMMHSIRAHHRAASPKDLPPPAKTNPLDYLKGKKAAQKVRR